MPRIIAIAALVLVLGLINWSIMGKEHHLAEGQTVYLHTAPVDPRSLMQGDYMTLRFKISADVRRALREQQDQEQPLENHEGFVVVRLDERRIGSFARLDDKAALAQNEVRMRYRLRNRGVKLATNAFFFQEGHGKFYQPARYGEFKVDSAGELLLGAMFDAELNLLQAKELSKPQSAD